MNSYAEPHKHINIEPLVSVIMIFLNAGEFIQEAIESVLKQTYGNWELLLVDDGSTDASSYIARQYATQYSGRIYYLEHESHQNRGMSASRNLGFRESNGQYIAFLDSDDVYLPRMLERQVAVLDTQTTAAMLFGTTQYWYSWTNKNEDRQRDRMRTLGVPAETLFQPPALFTLFLQNKARTPATCSTLIRREAFEQVSGFEEQFRGVFEDQVFFYKICLHLPVFVVSGCWSRYRQHPRSWCHMKRQSGEWVPGYRPSPASAAFLNWLETYLIEQKIHDPTIWRTLRSELWPYRHPKLSKPYCWTRQIGERISLAAKKAQSRRESLFAKW